MCILTFVNADRSTRLCDACPARPTNELPLPSAGPVRSHSRSESLVEAIISLDSYELDVFCKRPARLDGEKSTLVAG